MLKTKTVKKAVKKPLKKSLQKTKKTTQKRLHAYPVDPDLFSASSSLKSVIEYVMLHLEEKDSFTPYMLSICRKADSLNKPKRYAVDLIYDLKAFTRFFTMSSLGKSKNYNVYWFCRDTGTSMVIIDKDVWNEKPECRLDYLEALWESNKHHFKVNKNGCKSIKKETFFNDVYDAYNYNHPIYATL